MGYIRQGCCKCLKQCNPKTSAPETVGLKDTHNYCMKPQSYESSTAKNIEELDYK